MRVLLMVSLGLLVGCAAQTKLPQAPEADWQAEAAVQEQVKRQEADAALAAASRNLDTVIWPAVPQVPPEALPPKNPLTTIAQANGKALVLPRPEWFARGTLFFPRREGALYQVQTSVNQPTTFIFSADEMLLNYVGLEGKERWTVFQRDLDDDGVKQSILTVIPNEVKLTGGLQLVTTKAFYNVQLKSQEATGVLEVRWRHPKVIEPAASQVSPQAAARSRIYHVGYTIRVQQGHPTWVPLKVWDTGLQGKKTLVQFSPGLDVMPSPIVFAPNSAGDLEQVNYRKRGELYVIDLVAPYFELRLGVAEATESVRITRDKHYRSIRCPSTDGECPPEGI